MYSLTERRRHPDTIKVCALFTKASASKCGYRAVHSYQSGQPHIYFCLKLRTGLVSVTVCRIHSGIFQATFKLPGSAGTQAQAFCWASTAVEDAAAKSTQFGTKLRTSRGESGTGRLRLGPRPLYTRLAPRGRKNLKRQLEWFLKIF